MTALGLWVSPLGPVGQFKGALIRIGIEVFRSPTTISKKLGISQGISFILVAILAGGALLFFTFLSVYLTLPRQKLD